MSHVGDRNLKTTTCRGSTWSSCESSTARVHISTPAGTKINVLDCCRPKHKSRLSHPSRMVRKRSFLATHKRHFCARTICFDYRELKICDRPTTWTKAYVYVQKGSFVLTGLGHDRVNAKVRHLPVGVTLVFIIEAGKHIGSPK